MSVANSTTSIKLLIILSYLFIGQFATSQTIYKGFYFEEWKYRPQDNDTFYFEIYEDGTDRISHHGEYLYITEYKDLKKRIIDYDLMVANSKWNDIDQDSLKLIYVYKNGLNIKTIQLEKFAFKDRGGCFAWDRTKYCCVWYQTGYSTYEYDEKANCTRHINYLDYFGDQDTIIIQGNYEYDNAGRIVRSEHQKNGKLQASNTYQFEKDYKKTEMFNFESKLVERKEEFFSEGMLVKELLYKPSTMRREYTYAYDTKKRKQKIETFYINENNTKDLIITRTYYYLD